MAILVVIRLNTEGQGLPGIIAIGYLILLLGEFCQVTASTVSCSLDIRLIKSKLLSIDEVLTLQVKLEL